MIIIYMSTRFKTDCFIVPRTNIGGGKSYDNSECEESGVCQHRFVGTLPDSLSN